jgi:hypothetical protein
MEILFISSMAVISPEPQVSQRLYLDSLGLPLEADKSGDYFHSESVEGSKHFGIWPLSQAASSCFGSPDWPDDRPTPQASVEFEVASAKAVGEAEEELVAAGFDLLHPTKTEPWGQTVARIQTTEGVIVGISHAPWMHSEDVG